MGGGSGTNTSFGVVVAVVLCAAVCVATNLVTNTRLIKSGFHFPLTLLWFTGTSKAVLLIPKLTKVMLRRRREVTPSLSWKHDLVSVRDPGVPTEPGSVFDELLCFSILFVIYVAANASQLIAVSTISAGVVSAIFSTSPAFVCLISRVLLQRPFKLIEIAAVTLSISGMLCVAQPWHHASADGRAIAAAVLSPVAAAFHTTYFSHKFTGCGGLEVSFILGKLALFLFTLGGVGVAIATAAGVEKPVWHFPLSLEQKILLPACALTGWLFNGSTSFAVTVTYPLFVTIGTVGSTILTVVASGVITGKWPNELEIGGMVMISGGFALLVLHDWRTRRSRLNQPDLQSLLVGIAEPPYAAVESSASSQVDTLDN